MATLGFSKNTNYLSSALEDCLIGLLDSQQNIFKKSG